MKRRARYTPKKNKIHKCDACGYVSPSLKDYKHHVEFNPKCRQKKYPIVVTSVPMLDMTIVNLISTYKVVLSVNSLTRKEKLLQVRF